MIALLGKTKKRQIQPLEGYLFLDDVSWESYERILEALDGRHLRITFDRGSLEIMTLSKLHERIKDALRRMVDILIEELELPFECLASMTFKRKAKQKGLEPDECYWFHSEKELRDSTEYDPEIHPPADFILEIDITSSSLDRIGIYETLRVGEVWRWDGEQVEIRVLTQKGKLAVRKSSASFAGLKSSDLLPFLEMALSDGKAKMVKQFRKWVRERVAAGKIRFGG